MVNLPYHVVIHGEKRHDYYPLLTFIKSRFIDMGIYTLSNDRFVFACKAVSEVDAEFQFIRKNGLDDGWPQVIQVIEL